MAADSWDQAATGLVYDAASGLVSVMLEERGAFDALCLLNDGQVPFYADSRPGPVVGEGFYYLVRSENSCKGSYGTSSPGAERLPSGPCP